MPVEDSSDRAVMLSDFGVAARATLVGGQVDLRGIPDAPTESVGGIATELDINEPSVELIVATEDVSGIRVGDLVEILEGEYAGAYRAVSPIAEDDGAFTRILLGDS